MSAECSAGNIPPGYKQTEVGVIPEDWEVKPVGEAFEVHNHLRVPISQKEREKIAGKYPYYGPTGIQGYIKEYRIEGQYALIGEDGDHFLKWREMPMTLMVSGKFNVNNHAHVVKGTNNLTAWFYYYFSHKDLTQHLTRQGAGRYKLTKKTLLNIQCVLPSPPEQKAITEALSDTDAFIESLEQLIAKKRQIKQGAMQELLTGKKRLPVFSEEWKIKKLGDLATIQRGASPRPIDSPVWFDDNSSIVWVRISDVTRTGMFLRETTQRLSSLGVQHSRPVSSGSLIMSICATVGRPVITEIDICIHDGFVVFDGLRVDKAFLYYTLKSIEDDWSKHGQTGSQMNLNTGLINQTMITIPPTHEEQEAIAAILSDMDSEITALEEKLAKTRQIKQGMMQELLTGKIRLI